MAALDTGGEVKKWGKALPKQGIFPFSVGNIDHLLCLRKLEHPYESRIRQQYLDKLPAITKIPDATTNASNETSIQTKPRVS